MAIQWGLEKVTNELNRLATSNPTIDVNSDCCRMPEKPTIYKMVRLLTDFEGTTIDAQHFIGIVLLAK
uniref:Uncharacterized protein n=1 Tax=Angiostrongylus cantonensis TaxID=6313 RepID=A0A0K0DAR6_ANGCA